MRGPRVRAAISCRQNTINLLLNNKKETDMPQQPHKPTIFTCPICHEKVVGDLGGIYSLSILSIGWIPLVIRRLAPPREWKRIAYSIPRLLRSQVPRHLHHLAGSVPTCLPHLRMDALLPVVGLRLPMALPNQLSSSRFTRIPKTGETVS
jgi:hypothetical protein